MAVRVEPPLRTVATAELDLAIALTSLVADGRVGGGLRWILAVGRLGPDGGVQGAEGRVPLGGVVRRLCHTPELGFEHMFGDAAP